MTPDDELVERVALKIAGSLMLQMKHSAVHDFHGGDVATVVKLISDRDVCHAMARAAASRLSEMEAENKRLRSEFQALGKACANYRAMHDRLGGDHIDTGRAWDEMRRAEDKALSVFAARTALEQKS